MRFASLVIMGLLCVAGTALSQQNFAVSKAPLSALYSNDPLARSELQDKNIQSGNVVYDSAPQLRSAVSPLEDESLKNVCFKMRTYVVARDSHRSDAVRPVAYYTCLPGAKVGMKSADLKSVPEP
jgi:hypothetical protein